MMFFEDIIGGFSTLFADQYAIWFVILAGYGLPFAPCWGVPAT